MLIIFPLFVSFFSGCNSLEKTTVTTQGDKTITSNIKQKESPLKDKIWVTTSNATGIIVETSVSSSTDNLLPSIKIVTGGNSIATMDKNSPKLLFTRTKSAGLLNSLTSSSATSETVIFIGSKDDKGEGSAMFIKALSDSGILKEGE